MLPRMMQKLFGNGGAGTNLRADIMPIDGKTITINEQNQLEAKTSVTLSDSVDSTSSETAASSLAVKTAYDNAVEAQSAAATAGGKADAAQAAASSAQGTADDALAKAEEALNGTGGGSVTISDAVNSTSSTTAASSLAVKIAYDAAAEAQTDATQAMQKASEAAAVQTLLEKAVDMGEAAGDVVLDGKQGRVFTATLTAATTFSVINTEPGACLLLELHNAGAQVVTWAMLPRWAGGVAPLLAAAGSDLVALTHGNEGWYGVHVAADAR